MSNLISVNFLECSPSPSMGYTVWWRVAGSFDVLQSAGIFFSSPAIFYDNTNPPGTQYEGIIQSNCRGMIGSPVEWTTVVSESQSSSSSSPPGSSYIITQDNPCTGILSNWTLSGGTPGDIVVVRASFYGSIQMAGGLFTRADLGITSPDGTTGNASSTCYTDGSSHYFSIVADTTITMVGTTAAIILSAVVHNSLEGTTSATLQILTVNGVPNGFFIFGCRGNSATGGTC